MSTFSIRNNSSDAHRTLDTITLTQNQQRLISIKQVFRAFYHDEQPIGAQYSDWPANQGPGLRCPVWVVEV